MLATDMLTGGYVGSGMREGEEHEGASYADARLLVSLEAKRR